MKLLLYLCLPFSNNYIIEHAANHQGKPLKLPHLPFKGQKPGQTRQMQPPPLPKLSSIVDQGTSLFDLDLKHMPRLQAKIQENSSKCQLQRQSTWPEGKRRIYRY